MKREQILGLLDDDAAMRFTVVDELADSNLSPQLMPSLGGVTVAAHSRDEMFEAAYYILGKLKDAYEWSSWGLGMIITSGPLSIILVIFKESNKRPEIDL